jgi:hypothetical protein
MARGLTPSSTPVLLALWLANVLALVLGREHSPRATVDTRGGRP